MRNLEDQFYGYDFHSAQPCERLAGKLKLGSLRDTQQIDAWLVDHFGVDAEKLPAVGNMGNDDRRALANAVILRALVLYGELARAARLPCFGDARLLRVSPIAEEPDAYSATVALPVIDNMPLSLFRGLFRDAMRLVTTRLPVEPTPAAAAALFAELDQMMVMELRRARLLGSSALGVCYLAFQQQIPFRHIGDGVMRLGLGASSQLLHLSSIESDSAIGASICKDKRLTASTLGAAGLPAPEHIRVASREAALEAARELGWPVVVKPANRERSEGVTVNISTEDGLLAAYDEARSKSDYILVERHVPGLCHRIFVAEGKVLYAVKRLPKGLVANGRDTVRQLVEAANAARTEVVPWKRFKTFPLDQSAVDCLSEQGLTPESIPDEGRRVLLRSIPSDWWGGDSEDVTSQLHPANIQLALDAARLLGLTVAGVDLMSTDVSQPWYETGAIINEMNYRPQLPVGREQQLAELMPALAIGDGRIPVHLVTGGGNLLDQARELKRRLAEQGRICHLTTAGHSEDSLGQELAIGSSSLFERSLALAMRPDVHELKLVGEANELFRRGLAVDRLESAHIVDGDAERGERLVNEIRSRFPAQSYRRVTS